MQFCPSCGATVTWTLEVQIPPGVAKFEKSSAG
jgi:hypothetical protein